MAYSKKKVEAVEQALLDACKIDKEYEEADDSHLTRKKRDKLTAHVDNQIKKVSCDRAMEMSEDNKREQGIIEGTFEELKKGEEGYEVQQELLEKKKKNKELSEKLTKYGTGKKTIQDEIFKGLHMNEMQKKFVTFLCDPESPTYSDKHMSYINAGYTAKNKNSLMANLSMNLKKEKIKTAIDRYRKQMINSKKLEISTEMVEILRRRATYNLSTFYNEDGSMIPLSEIPAEWQCCVDDRSLDYKGRDADVKVERYKLCDRHKSMQELMKLMEIQQSISDVPKNVGGRPPSVQAAIDMGKDKDGNQGPRVVINMALFDED